MDNETREAIRYWRLWISVALACAVVLALLMMPPVLVAVVEHVKPTHAIALPNGAHTPVDTLNLAAMGRDPWGRHYRR